MMIAPKIEARPRVWWWAMKQMGLRIKVRLMVYSEAFSNYFGIGGHVLTPDFGQVKDLHRVGYHIGLKDYFEADDG